MKVLVICQHYYPEPFRISDICEELVKRGHSVSVVTGVPNYPEGIIYKEYEKKRNHSEVINGVDVFRCNIIPRKPGILYRFLNYYSFVISSNKHIKKIKNEYDVVLVNQLSPVMMAKAGITYAEKFSKPCVLYCLDLWPDSLIAGGIRRDSLIYKLYHRISRKIYCAADKLLVTSKEFIGFMSDNFGIDKRRISYLPQYAEELFGRIESVNDKDIFDLVFAGNIGEIQSIDTMIRAAEILKDSPIRWHIVGGGFDLDRLKTLASEKMLNNIVFYGRRSLGEMPHYYAIADAMLVSLKDDKVISLTLPGKVQSYMAAGKPIIGAINGEAKAVIEEAECGYCCEAENAEQLAEIILKFINSQDKEKFGNNARRYYEQNFTKEKFMAKLENELNTIVSKNEGIGI